MPFLTGAIDIHRYDYASNGANEQSGDAPALYLVVNRPSGLRGRSFRREKVSQRGQFLDLLRRKAGRRNDKSAG